MQPTITAEKAGLRRRAGALLKGLSPQARRESDDALFARFLALPQVAAADTLLLYHGMGTEPDTARLLPALRAMGKRVCLPRCLPGQGLEARLVGPDSALVPHPFGMLEPGADCPPVERDRIDLILVPGLAFDRTGNRMGYGGLAPADLRADLFKLGHHGQRDGISPGQIRIIAPRAVVCCASSDRRYNSAAPELLRMISDTGARLYFSDCPEVPDGIGAPPPHQALTIRLGGGLSPEITYDPLPG